MKISRVEIKNFRSIAETSFDITGGKIALVGGNESGKSNVLLALRKFLEKMDFVEEDKYQLSSDEPEITVTFSSFTDDETSQLNHFLNTTNTNIISIKRSADSYEVIDPVIPLDETSETNNQEGAEDSEESTESVSQEKQVQESTPAEAAETESGPEEGVSEPTLTYDQRQQGILDLMPKAVWIKTIEGLIKGKNIPLGFLFPELGEGEEQEKSQDLNDESLETIRKFLELGGINKDDFENEDTGSRFHTLNKKAAIIAETLSKAWNQERIIIRMTDADENLVIEFKDCGNIDSGVKSLDSRRWVWTYPEDRSDGFRWFVTFYSRYLRGLAETRNAIILIDEAGGALNKKAQEDLLKEFDKISDRAQNNQIIYASHSKFMVSWQFKNDVYAVIKNKGKGTEVSGEWWTKYKRNQWPAPLDELAVTWSDDVLSPGGNLVVEGPTDLEFLLKLKPVFHNQDMPNDPFRGFRIIPGMGVHDDSMLSIGNACKFHEFKCLLMFDSDSDRLQAKQDTVNENLEADDLNSLCGSPTPAIFTIEDLLPKRIFYGQLNLIGRDHFGEGWSDIGLLQGSGTDGIMPSLKARLETNGFGQDQIRVFLRDKKYAIVVNTLENSSLADFSNEQKTAIKNLYQNLHAKIASL